MLAAQPVAHVQNDALVTRAETPEGLGRLGASVRGALASEDTLEVAVIHPPHRSTVSGVSGLAEADRR